MKLLSALVKAGSAKNIYYTNHSNLINAADSAQRICALSKSSVRGRVKKSNEPIQIVSSDNYSINRGYVSKILL